MNKIKLLIVDDEPLAHKVIERYAENIDYIEIVGNCYDAISTINFLDKKPVDALLLDIQMPDLTGLELVEALRKNCPKVIFTTAYTEFALQSFDYEQVLDYLHKPIRLARFIRAMEKLKRQLSLESQFDPNKDNSSHPVVPSQDFIVAKDNKISHKIFYSEILYIQSWGNYLKFYLDSGKVQLTRKTIKEVNDELPTQQFEQIHKSYIVNIEKVQAIQGNLVLLGDSELPIGKSFATESKKKLLGI